MEISLKGNYHRAEDHAKGGGLGEEFGSSACGVFFFC